MFAEGLDSSLLIVHYVILKAKKKKNYSFGALATVDRHNIVYVTVGFNLKAVVF